LYFIVFGVHTQFFMLQKILLAKLFLLFLFSCKNAPQESKGDILLERNGVKIAYNSCGEADTTLLFVHGWGINKEYWEPQANYFCPRYKVVAVDLPGFGQSGKNRTGWSFDDYAADIKWVIDSLHLQNVILIGHSMSGDIVLNVGNKYPASVVGLVGIDNLHEPGSPMNAKEQAETDSLFSFLSRHFDSAVNQYMKPSLFQPTTDTAIVQRVMNDVYNSDSLIATQVLKSMTIISQQEQRLMQHLPYKLYLVNSDVYPVKADSLNKYCQHGFELMTVHATGHYPMLEKPDEFNRALEKVIAKIGGK
jgi:pimeloyl-ACP methyl ester carboxylesterase